MEDIKNRLKQLYVHALRLHIDPVDVGDQNLVASLGIDSISSLEVLLWVEDEFDIIIEDEDLSAALVDSLDTLASYIRSRLQAANQGQKRSQVWMKDDP